VARCFSLGSIHLFFRLDLITSKIGKEVQINKSFRGTVVGEILRLSVSVLRRKVFFTSFAQTSEDMLASTYLLEKKINYLDIGAGHPILGSNTFKYYLRGGNGTIVDPISTNIKLFKLFRPRDKRLRAFVSDTSSSNITFFETFPLGYSSNIMPTQKEMNEHKIELLRKYEISQIHLTEILPPLKADMPFLLSIDAEGHDLKILKSNDWHTRRPRVIITETLSNQDRIDTLDFMQKNDYIRISYSVLSSIFVAKEFLSMSSEIDHFIS
jgi:hypothetical protein